MEQVVHLSLIHILVLTIAKKMSKTELSACATAFEVDFFKKLHLRIFSLCFFTFSFIGISCCVNRGSSAFGSCNYTRTIWLCKCYNFRKMCIRDRFSHMLVIKLCIITVVFIVSTPYFCEIFASSSISFSPIKLIRTASSISLPRYAILSETFTTQPSHLYA